MLSCGSKSGKTASDSGSLTVDSAVVDTGIDKHSETYIREKAKALVGNYESSLTRRKGYI